MQMISFWSQKRGTAGNARLGRFAKDWKMQFNAKKCGVLVVGEKKKKML